MYEDEEDELSKDPRRRCTCCRNRFKAISFNIISEFHSILELGDQARREVHYVNIFDSNLDMINHFFTQHFFQDQLKLLALEIL